MTEIEQAYREGYDDGYGNGSRDECNFERGICSKRPSTLNQDKDKSWLDSESCKAESELASQRKIVREASEKLKAECNR